METDEIQFQPLAAWPCEATQERRHARFMRQGKYVEGAGYQPGSRMPVGRTITQLRKELQHLRAENIVILLDCDQSQITRQGWPRANARVNSPGVILTFDSKHGPLHYPCDTFRRWEDNLRAITLALENLRAVDRYGVTMKGEQYTGWKRLPGPGQTSITMTAGQAAEFLAKHSGYLASEMLRRPDLLSGAYRTAAAKLHPDRGGKADDFATLSVAKGILQQHHGAQ